jgi:hypothetical protein
MQANIYQTPEADLSREEDLDGEFYIVSRFKFLVLFIATLGTYGIFWFYKHFSLSKAYNQTLIWPIPRAIFSIFFAHSLFRSLFARVKAKDPDQSWSSGNYATTYVVFSIVGNTIDGLSIFGINELTIVIISFASLFIVGWTLYKAQGFANFACDDPDGANNKRITLLNYFWIILGILLWLITLFGVLVMTGVVNPY